MVALDVARPVDDPVYATGRRIHSACAASAARRMGRLDWNLWSELKAFAQSGRLARA